MSDGQNKLELFQPLLHWLKTHFNMHRFLWLLAFVLFLIAWNRGLALLYGIFALILGVLCLSYIYPTLFLRNISIKRKQKTVVKAGQKLKLEYTVKANRQILYMELCEQLPFNFSEPSFHYFLPVVTADYQFEVSVACELRGQFKLNDLSLESSYPFGIYSRRKAIETDDAFVMVLPKTFPIHQFTFALNSRQGREGDIQSSKSGFYNEFSGLREYRYGDSLKHIHWGSTARHQELMIKEYESYDRPTMLIVLDQHKASDVGELPETSFEYVIQITASIIEYAMENQIGVYVYGKGQHETRIHVMPGALGSREFLEKLAIAKADGDTDYNKVLAQALSEFENVNTVMTMTNRSAKISDKISSMIQSHYYHIDIDMVDESFINPMQKYPMATGKRKANKMTWSVSRTSELESLFQ